MDLDHELCYCFHVSKRKVVNFAKQTRPRRASQLSQCFGAGSGCGWCIPFLVKIHEQILRGDLVAADDITPDEYEAMRAQYRKAVADGDRERNSFVLPASPAPTPTPQPAPAQETQPGGQRTSEAPFDFTRYFSRSRPDPEPETLKNPDAQPKKEP